MTATDQETETNKHRNQHVTYESNRRQYFKTTRPTNQTHEVYNNIYTNNLDMMYTFYIVVYGVRIVYIII